MAFDSRWLRVERLFGDSVVIDERQQQAIDAVCRQGMELAQAILRHVEDLAMQDQAIARVHEGVMAACCAIARFPGQDEVPN